jgi:Rab family protein
MIINYRLTFLIQISIVNFYRQFWGMDPFAPNSDTSLKVIILGEANVGKTSILNQWLHGTFTEDTAPTIGAGLTPVQLMVDGAVQTFHVWDTAGTPQFRSVVPMYCRSAAIAVIVFDLTLDSSFEKVSEWHSFVKQYSDPMFILIGNKLDLGDQRVVDQQTAEELAARLGCRYIEMSAYTSEGVNIFGRAILECARECLAKNIYKMTATAQPTENQDKSQCNC